MSNKQVVITQGYTIKASAAAIAFLWSNWEVLYKLNPGPIKTQRLSESSWSGHGLSGSGEWHLVRREFTLDSGNFEYLSFNRICGIRIKAHVAMRYQRLDEDTVSYFGEGTGQLPAIIPRWLAEQLGGRVATYVNRIGSRTAELITRNPTIVREQAGSEAWKLYSNYLEEESSIRRGNPGALRYFSAALNRKLKERPSNELEFLKQKLDLLEQRIANLGEAVNIHDYHSALLVFTSDPKMALVKNRTIVEHIAKIVFEREMNQPSGSRMLGQLLDLLSKESDQIPSNILALMRTVGFLGNVGGHVESVGAARTKIDSCEFSVSFSSTLRVTEWFLAEYFNASETKKKI